LGGFFVYLLKMLNMKQFLVLLLIIFSLATKAQTPDTVCYHSNNSTYQVANDPNNTYTWTVAAPGIITGGQGTNQITVNWGTANPGLITNAITVFPTNQFGCVGPTVLLDVFILNIVPTVIPITLCANAGCVPLIGSPLGGIWSGPGVSGNQFCPNLVTPGTSTITYTYSLGGCTFIGTGTAIVNPLPTISPIQHN
jgi:hypothetical protein